MCKTENKMVNIPNYYNGLKSIVLTILNGTVYLRPFTYKDKVTTYQCASEGDIIYHRGVDTNVRASTLYFNQSFEYREPTDDELRTLPEPIYTWLKSDDGTHVPCKDDKIVSIVAKETLLSVLFAGIDDFYIGTVLHNLTFKQDKPNSCVLSFAQIKHVHTATTSMTHSFTSVSDNATFLEGLSNSSNLKARFAMFARFTGTPELNWRHAKRLPEKFIVGSINNDGRIIRQSTAFVYDKEGNLLNVYLYPSLRKDCCHVDYLLIDLKKQLPKAYKMIYITYNFDSFTNTLSQHFTWNLYRVR